MELNLTDDEKNLLIWQEGDFFESVRGEITFTASRNITSRISGESCVERTFFFNDTETGTWKTMEWCACVPQEVPNGPAQMILLRRGDHGCVFGIISLINGAWSPVWPLTTIFHYRKSSRRRRMVIWGRLASVLFFLLHFITMPLAVVTFGLLMDLCMWVLRKMKESWQGLPEKEIAEIEKSARALLHRLVEAQRSEQTQGRL